MAEMTEAQYEAVAARLTDPATPLPAPANVQAGAEAEAAGRALMVKEYGSDEALDTVLREAGRPRLGEKARGASPTVRARIPEADRAAFERLMQQTGKRESELVREAVHRLLVEHHLAS
ncbi:hypothetical protein SCB71_01935 [Herbiconiux sp. KACC 21604]|uniref:hypothetical protein n=1 Tax=unclassified Herbiconiux TaxID=2618217 RepID=UPI00149318C1|nr:hypothetical protein [Herbiconiux sp. SALV-R1]QJU55810.1 hypothetical protein HL652_20795 [Herbiconiux sp. SALV-R1]WPO87024.1 hypothetical protein SCB71_01935 [Herbiconiux sp. KACC 21604]